MNGTTPGASGGVDERTQTVPGGEPVGTGRVLTSARVVWWGHESGVLGPQTVSMNP